MLNDKLDSLLFISLSKTFMFQGTLLDSSLGDDFWFDSLTEKKDQAFPTCCCYINISLLAQYFQYHW